MQKKNRFLRRNFSLVAQVDITFLCKISFHPILVYGRYFEIFF